MYRYAVVILRHLQVHSWGGLGSQLFALAYALEMQGLKPGLHIRMVVHSSGVTRRNSEIDISGFSNLSIQVEDDFWKTKEVSYNQSTNMEVTAMSTFKHSIRYALSRIGFIVFDDSQTSKLRPWTWQVRHHYYLRPVPHQVITDIIRNAPISFKPSFLKFDHGIVHYRLGDLVSIINKSPIDSAAMKEVVLTAKKRFPNLKWRIESDSPEEAKQILLNIIPTRNIDVAPSSTWETLRNLSLAKVLIASPSKLSVWGILIGINLEVERTVYIPKSLLQDISRISKFCGRTTFITY